MKHKHHFLILLLLVTAVFNSKAQETLGIDQKDGAKTLVKLSEVKKITFSSGTLNLFETDGKQLAFNLSDIQKVYFTSVTLIANTFASSESPFIIYPVPVLGQATIHYPSTEVETIHISIINMQGQTVWKAQRTSVQGENFFMIDLNDLSKGIYICKLQAGSTLSTQKFTKN